MVIRGNVIVQPLQIRMARAALDWSIVELAEHAGVSEKTVRRLEGSRDHPEVTITTYESIVRTLVESGITFVCAVKGKNGPGVCLMSPKDKL